MTPVSVLPQYACNSCHAISPRWHPQCVKCGEFGKIFLLHPGGTEHAYDDNSMSNHQSVTPLRVKSSYRSAVQPGGPLAPPDVPAKPDIVTLSIVTLPLSAASMARAAAPRRATGIAELDRVLGGGLVDGSFVLIGGSPGSGKSTLTMQVMHSLVRNLDKDGALYASGEESREQVLLRAARLGIENVAVKICATDDIEAVIELAAKAAPTVLVVDSVQTMHVSSLDSDPGSMMQVAAVAARLAKFAKETKTPVIVVGHVTKDGQIAGPKTLEHLVDVVLYLETSTGARRRLESPKNRYGSTSEIGTFEMRADGMHSIEDDGASALAERAVGVPGSAVFPMVLGERVQLVEVQALVGSPKCEERPRGTLTCSGCDPKRVQMIVAILARHARIDASERDVFVSVTAGARLNDPAADLPIALAIASSFRDLPILETCACFGELGLAGEIRSVDRADARSAESARHGLCDIISDKCIADAIGSAIGEAVKR